MDKSWINLTSRASIEYINGVNKFLDFAFARSANEGKIWCPCVRCVNTFKVSRADAFDHIICKGFLKGYVRWFSHGEVFEESTSTSIHHEEESELGHEIDDLLHDITAERDMNVEMDGTQFVDAAGDTSNSHKIDSDKFYSLLKDAEVEQYPNCKNFTKLSFVIHLFHIKCFNGWTNKSLNTLLKMLKLALPDGNTLPGSYHEMKKMISALSLGYEKIHACPNNCMLFWKDKAKEEICTKCGASRWKEGLSEARESDDIFAKRKKKAAKILRWFPLIPRLQRLFMSSKTAPSMRWHEEERNKDGRQRHPADSLAWKHLDSVYPQFASDARNIRLGLASDGFNPFKSMNVNHSTWPVIMIPYNLPLWICMKQSNFILSLLIPGPKGPGNNLDVYLQPLIDELQELWQVGVETFDVSTKQKFQMRAALLWTINDFPAYANLSGWSTKGKYACPSCGYDTESKWLQHSGKFYYMGHRRWLEPNHRFRKDKHSFDGTNEFRSVPLPPSREEVLRQLENLNGNEDGPWKKKSILYTLSYWKHLLLRHNLDVMYIEKNVCDNILGTLIGQVGKSKDNYKARLDLVSMGIRSILHPKTHPGSNTQYLPQASYQMSMAEKNAFLKILKEMRTPDEYSCNISRCVQLKEKKLIGLKSYDCHLLMQEFIPIAVRWCLPEKVCSVLIDLCNFFQVICSKVLEEGDLQIVESRATLILCEMEKIFPPSFFTVMIHLVIHLAQEARVAGPVIYRWMYPIERFLLTLKSYVGNRACPEGSIAEAYLANECLTFCSRYLEGVETSFNQPVRNEEGRNPMLDEDVSSFESIGRPLGRKKHKGFNVNKRKRVSRAVLDELTLVQAHRYVLFNCDEVAPFLKKHEQFLRRRNRSPRLSPYELQKLQSETFHEWFRDHVAHLDHQGNVNITNQLRCLARGPLETPRRFTGYVVNGFRFHTRAREKWLKAQNSGVVVTTEMTSYASARDGQPVEGEVNYYGALTDIIQLNYSGNFKVVLFRCDWVDLNRGCKKDKFGFTLVNFSHLAHSGTNLVHDPFVLASQAKKGFLC